jgi:ribosomal protein L11 methyltransferase
MLDLRAPVEFTEEPADVVVANILAGPLDELAPLFARCVKPPGWIALSGILRGQEPALLKRYAEWFDSIAIEARDDWMRISGRRRA